MANLPMTNLRSIFKRFKDMVRPFMTKSFKHLPPDPSGLNLVLVEASRTGLAGVEMDCLNTTLQGIKWCNGLDRRSAWVCFGRSFKKIAWPLSNNLCQAFKIICFVAISWKYFLHCCSSTFSAAAWLGDKNSSGSARRGSKQLIFFSFQSSLTDSLITCSSASSLKETFSVSTEFLQSEQERQRGHL